MQYIGMHTASENSSGPERRASLRYPALNVAVEAPQNSVGIIEPIRCREQVDHIQRDVKSKSRLALIG